MNNFRKTHKTLSFMHNYRLSVFVVILITVFVGKHYFDANYEIINKHLQNPQQNTSVIEKNNTVTSRTPTNTKLLTGLVKRLVKKSPKKEKPVVTSPAVEPSIKQPKNWAFYIKNVDLAKVRNSKVDLIVTDVGSKTIPTFSRKDIQRVKISGKTVIAYLSLGSAETYRSYWKEEWNNFETRPSWIGPSNKLWKGNFHITQLLNPEWKKIAFKMIDNVMNHGFSGILVSGLDAPDSVEFLKEVHDYVKKRNKKFLIFVQNFIDPRVVDLVDGVVQENIFYNYGLREYSDTQEILKKIKFFVDRKKIILGVSYTSGDVWAKVKRLMKENRIVPYAAPLLLDKLKSDQ